MKIWVDVMLFLIKNNTTIFYRKRKGGIPVYGTYTAKIGPYVAEKERVGEIHYDAFKSWKGPRGSYEDVSPLGLSRSGN